MYRTIYTSDINELTKMALNQHLSVWNKIEKTSNWASQAVGREFESRCPLQIIRAFQPSGMGGLAAFGS